MPLYRAQVAIQADTALAADAMVVTPWFMDNGATTDPTNLATGLVDIFVGQATSWSINPTECTCRIYEQTSATQTGPPVATVTKYKGTTLASSVFPRETAVCLSFYADRNEKSRRGRLYLPMSITSLGYAARPGGATMTRALSIGTKLAALGGLDVDWVVYSRTKAAHYKVTDCWVDDEWDTQRRRGLRPTTRQKLATGS